MTERPILMSAPMVRALLAGRKAQTRRVVKPRHDWHVDEVPDRNDVWRRWPVFEAYVYAEPETVEVPCPYGVPGDHLWLRETWAFNGQAFKNYGPKNRRQESFVTYAADNSKRTHYCSDDVDLLTPKQTTPMRGEDEDEFDFLERSNDYYKRYFSRWRPSIHMPHWASRITLAVAGVRVERLCDISEADAIAEGIEEHRGIKAAGVSSAWRDYGHAGRWCSDAVESYRSLWESINGPGSWAANPWVWAISFEVLP